LNNYVIFSGLEDEFNKNFISKRLSLLDKTIYRPNPKEMGQPALYVYFIGKIFKKRTYYQGYGRHTQEEGTN
jgi:hypothetical protein